MLEKRTIEITEYVPKALGKELISEVEGESLYRNHKSAIGIEFPSPKTDWCWQLTSLGWVGHIPVTPQLELRLNPRVPIGNLFRMLEYAYALKSFQFLKGLVEFASVQDYFERLANILAKRILDRGRVGYYKTYIPRFEPLSCVRGRMDLNGASRAPWNVRLNCHYEEHTSDIEDNQILAWTLWVVAKSGVCSNHTLPTIRRAFRAIEGFASLLPSTSEQCCNRTYNRLNDDYKPLHALCRLFLEHCGPSHDTGQHSTLPFLVDMNRLFELFVAEWLKAHLPCGFAVKAQERIPYGADGSSYFAIDLVVHSLEDGQPVAVLDTKYKSPDTPAPDDVAQVVAYAESLGCQAAFLVYPTELATPLTAKIGNIRVRSLAFSLGGDLENSGGKLLNCFLS